MSSIPTPLSKSKLPKPPTVGKSLSGSSIRATASSSAASNLRTTASSSVASGLNGAVKRPRVPGDADVGQANKRTRMGAGSMAPPAGNLAKAKSMVNINKPKKRAPWDLKGRLEDMEALYQTQNQRVSTLETQNTVLKTNVEEKENVVAQSSQEMVNCKAHNKELQSQVDSLKKELSESRDEAEEKIRKLKREIEDHEFNHSSKDRKIKALEDELSSKQEEVAGLRTSVAQLTSSAAGIDAELKQCKSMLASEQNKVADLTKLSSGQAAQIEEYEAKTMTWETERRKLHNTIQELKGNIRVFCRIRPLLPTENNNGLGVIRHIVIDDDKSLALVRSADSPNDTTFASGLKNKNGKYDFEFDRVFRSTSSQAEVFDEISQLVQSAIDGYHVCVFAYGQTGSGKTFTMEGGEQEGQEGMIPLTIAKIFNETERLSEKGWSYKLDASFLEIYNEEIRDLLATEGNLKYEIKMTKEGEGTNVTNLKVETVKSQTQIENLLLRARKNRAVAATNCNERSSRSHSVFQLRIVGHNDATEENCSGLLNLVDLAGSERLKDSGSEGVRLTETKSINKSLANLGNVIMALAQKDSHIPYRNSKLTHLLQSSLGGNSKTLMFVNISPREEFFGETLNSLRFATKVNQCQIGTATKKIK